MIDGIVEQHIARLQARVEALEVRDVKRRAREAKYVERIRALELESGRRRHGAVVVDEISPKEYAARYRVSVPTVRRAYRDGKLQHDRRGGLIWIPASALIAPRRRAR